MATISVTMPTFFRRSLYTLLAVSWCTGLTFFVFLNWVTIEGDFGPEKHPLQFSILQLHGACAFLMMMFYGALLGAHLPASWKTKRSRNIGIGLATLIGLQIISAYGLYYLSDEEIRQWVSWFHLGLGGGLPVMLATHVVMGLRSRSARRNARRSAINNA